MNTLLDNVFQAGINQNNSNIKKKTRTVHYDICKCKCITKNFVYKHFQTPEIRVDRI